MKNIIANMIGGGVISLIFCVILSTFVPGNGTAIVMAILYALPGLIAGATITVLEYLKDMKNELKGEKKEEK